MQVNEVYAQYWLSRAAWLSRFVNLLWWLERLVPYWVAVNLLACCAFVFLAGQGMAMNGVIWMSGGALCVAGLISAGLVWRRKMCVHAALLRIETALQLNNRLTTAHDGHVAWPEPVEVPLALYQVRWQRPLLACVLSFAVALAGLLMPLGKTQESSLAANPSPPLALAEVESWIDELGEEEFIEEKALDKLDAAVESLKLRPSEEWYTAGALEAADNLNEHVEHALSQLATELSITSAVLSSLTTAPDDLSLSQIERIQEVYRESLDKMEMGALPISEDLMQQFRQMDFDNFSEIDPEMLQSLKDRSEHWAQACQGLCDMTDEEAERLRQYYESLTQEGGQPGSQQCTAPGAIQRGRGDAEMSYTPYRSDDSTAMMEAVSNDDLRNAAIGDTIRTSVSDKAESGDGFSGPSKGGGVSGTGSGGDAVWIDRLTPAERKVLQKYFD